MDYPKQIWSSWWGAFITVRSPEEERGVGFTDYAFFLTPRSLPDRILDLRLEQQAIESNIQFDHQTQL